MLAEKTGQVKRANAAWCWRSLAVRGARG